MHRIGRFAIILGLIICTLVAFEGVIQAQASNTWSSAGQMTQAREGAAAVLLSDGRILITGGSDSNGVSQTSTEIYNPNTGTFSAAPPMNVARANHAAIVLMTGDVLVTGGLTGPGGGYSDSAELYSVTAQQWTLLQASLGTGLAGHTMANLSDGNVLIAGGASTVGPVSSLLLFKPSDRSIGPVGTLMTARTDAAAAETPDGRVLIAGGTDINGAVLVSTEIFAYNADTASGSTSVGPNLTLPRTRASATATYDGVAVIGGSNGASDLGSAEIFSQWTNMFRVVAGGTPRSHHFAALLPNNGAVLALGGTGGISLDLLQPWANNTAGAFFAGANSLANHAGGIAAPAKLGSLLVAGGQADSGAAAELYWFPTISTDLGDYPPGTPVVMTGTGFQPRETVDLHMHVWSHQTVVDPPDYAVPTDDTGAFIFNGYAPNTTDLGARYHLTAIGETSGLQAQTVFTDGNPDNTSVILTCAPNPVPTSGTTCTAEADNIQSSPSYGYPQGTAKFSITTPNATGTFTPSNSCTLSQIGSARKSSCSVTFTPTSNTGGTIKAQYNTSPNNWNNGNATFDYTLTHVTTSLAVATASGTFGGTVSLSATLTAGTTGVGGKVISFTLNGASVGTAITDANGVATLSSVSLSGINVGTSSGAIAASFTADTTYLASSGSNALTVNQATAMVTLSNLSQTYTGNALTPIASTSPAGLKIVWTGAPQTNAGTYSVTATVDDPNYTGSASDSLVIGKIAASVTPNAGSKTYGTSDPTLSGILSGFVPADNVMATYSRTLGETVAGGPYMISATLSPAGVLGNYNITYNTANFTINKADATIRVTPYTATYDGQAHTASASITGINGESGGTVGTVNLINTTHTAAGTYSSDSWTFTGTANYNDIAATAITDTINKATPDCSSIAGFRVTYDGSSHSATGVCTGVGGVALSGLNLSGTTHTNAGTYMGDAWAFTDTTGNYNNASGTVNDSIEKAAVTATAGTFSGTYTGSAQTIPNCSVTGTYTGNVTCTNSPSFLTNAGNGTVTPTVSYGTDSSSNYAVTLVNGSWAINKATATVTVTPYTATYDGQSHTATATATGVNGETLSGLDLSVTTHTGAGAYPNDSWTFTDVTGNYNNADGTVSDSIAKANAVVSVTPYIATYDGSAHTATGRATGVNGETLSGLDLSGTTHTGAGTYANDSWTFTDSTGNYNNANGTVSDSIAKANAVVSVTPYTATYDGSAHTATGTATGVKGEALSGLDLSGTTHTGAGTYPNDSWTFTDSTGNYNNANGTISDAIAQAPSTVTVTCPVNVTYNGKAQTPCTGTVTGAGSPEQSLTWTYTINTNAGTAAAIASFPGDVNHTSSNGTGTFTINPAPVTVTAGSYTGVYDGSSHAPSDCKIVPPNALGYISGLSCTNNPASVGPDVNSGSVTPSVSSDDLSNFAITSVNGSWSITRANANVNVTPYSVTYDGNAHSATATATGVKGEDLSSLLALSGTTHTNSGDFPGDAWSFAGNSNYKNASGTVHDQIGKANATISVTPYSVIYDGNAHTATGTATGVKGEALSGLNLSGTTHTSVGTFTEDQWTFTDATGNYNNTNGKISDSIKSWTVTGFYSPVVPTPSNSATVVWNTIKGGSTVPLKFNIYAGSVQKTSTAAVQGGSIALYLANCNIGGMVSNATDMLVDTGATALRYDTTGLQFIENWKTPKGAGACYVAIMTAADGSTLQAYFTTN